MKPRGRGVRNTLAGIVVVGFTVVLFPGMAPATVEEQRARLPPPAQCEDPVEGVWMSHKFDPVFQDWYIFTARIRRASAGSRDLTGDIEAHSWEGGAAAVEPPACRPGLNHWSVLMQAQGTLHGRHIEFWGIHWEPLHTWCGRTPQPGEYNLDHFTGEIDPAIQEFQSVNNDGGRSVNDPTVFRRVRCFDPPNVPHVTVAPPPFVPPEHRGGCTRFSP